jgi:predicted transposase YbfD/YdcC
MSVGRLVEEFSTLEDPRCGGKIEHRLLDILVIAICAVIAGAERWEDIALYGRSKIDWLRKFLVLPNGIPAHDTFRRVFMLIDPAHFEACFEAWARSFGAARLAHVFDRRAVWPGVRYGN